MKEFTLLMLQIPCLWAATKLHKCSVKDISTALMVVKALVGFVKLESSRPRSPNGDHAKYGGAKWSKLPYSKENCLKVMFGSWQFGFDIL